MAIAYILFKHWSGFFSFRLLILQEPLAKKKLLLGGNQRTSSKAPILEYEFTPKQCVFSSKLCTILRLELDR